MDCVTFRKNIEQYLAGNLSDEELNSFLLHLDSCQSCGEELEINYIVSEGVRVLDEERADFDLKHAFLGDLGRMRAKLRLRKSLIRLSYVFDTLTFWALICAVFVYLRIIIKG